MKTPHLSALAWLAALTVAASGVHAQTQNAAVRGSGTSGQIVKWTGPGQIGDSVVTEVDGRIGIGTTTPGSPLTVAGRIEAATTGISPALLGLSPVGTGVLGNSTSGIGVFGSSGTADGVRGVSASGNGLFGFSTNGNGVSGNTSNGSAAGVFGVNNGSGGHGVLGQAFNGAGVRGISSTGFGVFGSSHDGFGVHGTNTGGTAAGVFGEGDAAGVLGVSHLSLGAGVSGINTGDGIGATGQSPNGLGVFGHSNTGVGVLAQSAEGGTSILAIGSELAGRFVGDVTVTGVLSKGGGAFRIDHPLDPANKYLSHSFVESPDMLNIYTGNVTTDDNGDAGVVLPEYFMALNRSFRYQLTVIGQFAQAIVAQEITDRRFTIKTDKPRVKVSWQVTGIRQDAWANRHRIRVEEDKPDAERGYFLHPELYDQPEERQVDWARRPELMKRAKDAKQQNR